MDLFVFLVYFVSVFEISVDLSCRSRVWAEHNLNLVLENHSQHMYLCVV
jgi:hypothetical protein